MGDTWLVAELQRPMELLAIFTGRYPGATIDIIADRPIRVLGDNLHPCIMLVRNAPGAALDGLVDALSDSYGSPVTIRRSRNDDWLARLIVPQSALHDAGLEALMRFQASWGMPWVHMEHGVIHSRARIEPGVDPNRLLRQVKGYLEAQGIDMHLSLQEMSDRDFNVWRELVEKNAAMIH